MAKYIKCDNCGKKIYFGEEVYKFHGYAGLYCSAECFADSYGEVQELDTELADDCYHKVYDTEEEKQRLQRELDEAQRQLAALANQVHTMKTQLHELELVSTTQN